jgi:drug/metabolite transporter (DMT)-like permease
VVYLIRLSSTDDTLFYARGMYLYASLSNLGLMSAYGFLGSIVALFIQKLDKKTKYRQLAIVTLIGLVCVGLLFGFSSIYADAIKINIIFLLLILMVLAIGFYFLENLISQKKYQNYLKSKEEKTKD